MPIRLSAFPKCYLDAIAGDRSMSVFDWITMARPLDADGLEMYEGFFTSLEPAYLDSVGDAIVLVDSHGETRFANHAAGVMLGEAATQAGTRHAAARNTAATPASAATDSRP